MASSITWSERFEYFSSFLNYIFRHKLASFCFFPTNIYTVLPLSNYYSIFKAKANENWARGCVNWQILQVKIEKETYSWDLSKILLQLNYLFAEINIQRLLIKENFKN